MKHLLSGILILIGVFILLILNFFLGWHPHWIPIWNSYPYQWFLNVYIFALLLMIIIGYGRNLLYKSVLLILISFILYLTDQGIQQYLYFKKEGMLDALHDRVFESLPILVILAIIIVLLSRVIWLKRGKK